MKTLREKLLNLIASWNKRLEAPSALQRSIYKEIVLDLFKMIHEYDIDKKQGQQEIIGFKIEEDKINKGLFILIAIDEEKNEWVVSGYNGDNHYLIRRKQYMELQLK